jgi:hypothetical protein
VQVGEVAVVVVAQALLEHIQQQALPVVRAARVFFGP